MKPSCRVSWFVETRGVTVCACDGRAPHRIAYPQAGLWALVANGNYSPARAAELMSVLMSVGEDEARREVNKTLAGWRQAGLLAED